MLDDGDMGYTAEAAFQFATAARKMHEQTSDSVEGGYPLSDVSDTASEPSDRDMPGLMDPSDDSDAASDCTVPPHSRSSPEDRPDWVFWPDSGCCAARAAMGDYSSCEITTDLCGPMTNTTSTADHIGDLVAIACSIVWAIFTLWWATIELIITSIASFMVSELKLIRTTLSRCISLIDSMKTPTVKIATAATRNIIKTAALLALTIALTCPTLITLTILTGKTAAAVRVGSTTPHAPVIDHAYCNPSWAATDQLIVDCGATKHCMSIEELTMCATTLKAPPTARYVRVASGQLLPVEAIGDVSAEVKTIITTRRKGKITTRSGKETMHLTNVLGVRGIKAKLFSCEWGHKRDNIQTYLNDRCELVLPSGGRVPFTKARKHYTVDAILSIGGTSPPTHDDCVVTHNSLMHFSHRRIDLAAMYGVPGMNLFGYKHDPATCPACMANRRKLSVPKASVSGREYTYFGQSVCSDCCGEFPESLTGMKYAVNFYDKATKHASVYFVKAFNAQQLTTCFEGPQRLVPRRQICT